MSNRSSARPHVTGDMARLMYSATARLFRPAAQLSSNRRAASAKLSLIYSKPFLRSLARIRLEFFVSGIATGS